jgi:hypothetical protein
MMHHEERLDYNHKLLSVTDLKQIVTQHQAHSTSHSIIITSYTVLFYSLFCLLDTLSLKENQFQWLPAKIK